MEECSHLGASLVIMKLYPNSQLIVEPGDILDPSELGEPNPPSVIIPTLRPVDKIKYPIDIIVEPIIDLPVEFAYRKRRSIFEGIYACLCEANKINDLSWHNRPSSSE